MEALREKRKATRTAYDRSAPSARAFFKFDWFPSLQAAMRSREACELAVLTSAFFGIMPGWGGKQ
jgi:hypothetical protein